MLDHLTGFSMYSLGVLERLRTLNSYLVGLFTHRLHFRSPTWVTLYCIVLVCITDVINLSKKIFGVRSFIPLCSLVSLYVLTNISYLSSFTIIYVWYIFLLLLETHFSLSCYMVLFSLVTVGKNEFGICLGNT